MRRLSVWMAGMICLAGICGCMSWEPGWNTELPVGITAPQDSGIALDMAADLETAAWSRNQIITLIRLYERGLQDMPENRMVLNRLATYYTLMGTYHSRSTVEKKRHFIMAIQYSEKCMALNPAFKARIDEGAAIWETCDLLEAEDVPAMVNWYTAVFYYYKECTTIIGKIANSEWVPRIRPLLERVDQLNVASYAVANTFSWGIYYLALPPGQGRDLEKSREYFDRAVEMAPDSVLPRWGRAKYYYGYSGNRDGYLADLEWVVNFSGQDSYELPPWTKNFQREARALLES